jgi:hypothetical protein
MALFGKVASVKILNLPNLPDKGDVSDWLSEQNPDSVAEDLQRLVAAAPLWMPSQRDQPNGSPWNAAQSAPVFIGSEDVDTDWLDFPLFAPGCLTEIFSPRGIGKTHVALAKAVDLARRGLRVLLVDRDNSRSEIRRRLKAWGANEAPTLQIITRDDAPPLTDIATWATFPFQDYDLLIVDSLDSSAEGVGEKDSSKPSRAIAPLLDIAHKAAGPAILILGNTIKNAQHSRGNGVIEDRADICFEVRDATAFVPTGQKPWWEELPPGGADAWAQRSSRRQRRDVYRLAFIPSKFRVGEEPNPFVLEINLIGEQWSLREVTDEVTRTGEETRQGAARERENRLFTGVTQLATFIDDEARHDRLILCEKNAVPFLCERGVTRSEARAAIERYDGQFWRVVVLDKTRGRPRVLMPIGVDTSRKIETAAEISQSKTLQPSITCNGGISADPVNIDRRKSILFKPASTTNSSGEGLFPPELSNQAGWSEKV